ncbi:MAG: hypothetical protein UIH27_15155 [Ruminococcus sp.]|nr:hypothetical protein [Ruminococcus sp.]
METTNIRVRVMSRFDATYYCSNPHDEEAVIISISTPYFNYEIEPYINAENGVKNILKLSFFDADEPNGLDVNNVVAANSDLMSDEDAEKIANFVERNKQDLIIVHCDAGISRSSAVAAAILLHYTGDDSAIFDNERAYSPNMWVYFKVLKAFGHTFFSETT